jgi:site-specific DNA recombinase
MKSAAIYCRVSTEDQEREGTSLQTQLEACLNYCKGYDVAYRFSEAYSGLSLDRPNLNELRRCVRNGEIDVVVVYCLDRFSRDPTHGVILQEELEKHGVTLEAVTETIESTELGKLISYIRGFASKLEAEKIRERTMRGKRQKSREGKLSTGGPCLFGYEFEYIEGIRTRKRIINPSKAEIIRRIFELIADKGFSLYGVASKLNSEEIETAKGARWSQSKVHKLVTNSSYMGITQAFRYRVVEPKNPKKQLRPYAKTNHVFRDKSEWIPIPNAYPPIISPELFEATQKQLKLNKPGTPDNRKHEHLFTNGRLRCGICGLAMTGSQKDGYWLSPILSLYKKRENRLL